MSRCPPKQIATRFGTLDVEGIACEGQPCLSIDLRSVFDPAMPDESALVRGGVFRKAIYFTKSQIKPEGELVGEIRLMVRNREVRVVAEATQRPGVLEVTLDQFFALLDNPSYVAQWQAYFARLQS